MLQGMPWKTLDWGQQGGGDFLVIADYEKAFQYVVLK